MQHAPLMPVSQASRVMTETTLMRLASAFERERTFWDLGNAAAGSDEHFTMADWWRVVRTVPDMRQWMLMALAWNCIAPKWPKDGFSEAHSPGRKYNFKYSSFFSDLMVLEAMGRSAKESDFKWPESFLAALIEFIERAWKNAFPTPYEGHSLNLFAYPPPIDHRIPKTDPIHKLFVESGKNVPENDSSCFIRSGILHVIELFSLHGALFHDSLDQTHALLRFLKDHIRGTGKYGQKEPSYAAGVLDGENPLSVWVFDEHNEYEPFCNVNMLEYLANVWRFQPQIDSESLCAISRGVLRYLANHAERGDLTSPRFMHYYPLGVSLYLWWRFTETFSKLGADEQSSFDPLAEIPKIERELRRVTAEWDVPPVRMDGQSQRSPTQPGVAPSEFDILMSAPFIYSRGMHRPQLRARSELGEAYLKPLLERPHTLCHMLYPSKILCMPIELPTAALLDLIHTVEKNV